MERQSERLLGDLGGPTCVYECVCCIVCVCLNMQPVCRVFHSSPCSRTQWMVLLVHLTFLPDSNPCSTQRGVRTSHICKAANTVWRRWQWGWWANVMCRYRNKSCRTCAPLTEYRLLSHIWPQETHINEKQKVSLAHFSLSAMPHVTAGHDITS